MQNALPTFCRHNRFIQNCPICSRERAEEMRDVVTPAGSARTRPPARRSGQSRSGGMQVRRLARGADDGFRSPLVAGVKSSEDAERLAEELAFAAARLARLEDDPPGCYAEVAVGDGDIEERTWLAFLTAYLCPTDGEDPFAGIRAARVPWSSGEAPALAGVPLGPRTAHEPDRGTRTLDAYRAWAGRAGSQAAAFSGEASWSPERRFARVFERLALPGLHRDARFDLLVTLGRVGVYELRAGTLELGGANEATTAAKRALGIGDTLLLERRAADLAEAAGIPLEALDLGLHNWGVGRRITMGLEPGAEPDPDALESTRAALGL
jgi:hypothetical protein